MEEKIKKFKDSIEENKFRLNLLASKDSDYYLMKQYCKKEGIDEKTFDKMHELSFRWYKGKDGSNNSIDIIRLSLLLVTIGSFFAGYLMCFELLLSPEVFDLLRLTTQYKIAFTFGVLAPLIGSIGILFKGLIKQRNNQKELLKE